MSGKVRWRDWTARKQDESDQRGFTLLEVMVAVAIFGFLMMYVAQLLGSQIRLFNRALDQNDLEYNARTAMMHILDEIRLHPSTYYFQGQAGGQDEGIYYIKKNTPPQADEVLCLLDVRPDVNNLPPGTGIYLTGNQLWFRDGQKANTKYLIADKIASITLEPVYARLLKIVVTTADNTTDLKTFRLVTWARLY